MRERHERDALGEARRKEAASSFSGQATIVYSPMPARVAPWIAALLLVSAAGLAWSAASTDSVTVDEPAHVTAGYASLVTGDYRLSPDHPPLARWLLALPLLVQPVRWPAAETEAWRTGDIFTLGNDFFERWNDGQALIRASRRVAIGFLLALIATVGWIARRLHGVPGSLLAMAIVAFDPNWLAHGHLATIDVPFALAALVTLATAHRWLESPSPRRLALLTGAFAALTLVKLSWPIVVPALVAMAVAARWHQGPKAMVRSLAIAGGTLALTSVFAIWAAYGFRFAAASQGTPPGVHMLVLSDRARPLPKSAAEAWETVLHDPLTGVDRRGAVVPVLRAAHAGHLLPEAYLYGLAYVGKSTLNRAAYLRGEYSMSGFASYFPWALAVKTPLPTLLLFAAGLAAVAFRIRPGGSWSPLATGLAVFASTHLISLAGSSLNIGYRHLLPVTAVLAIAAGALAAPLLPPGARRPIAVAVGAALVWLVAGTLVTAPHWIGYFNEAAGGWRNGHRYLLDSNLDWGQDLLRLRARLAGEPDESPVWLLQAGDPPLPRRMKVRWLWGASGHTPDPGAIAGGLYAVSATDLFGVTRPLARAESWRDPQLLGRFERAAESAAARRDPGTSPVVAIDEFEALRRLRLISRLALRSPDERIGTSLFLFRLSDAEVAEWTTP